DIQAQWKTNAVDGSECYGQPDRGQIEHPHHPHYHSHKLSEVIESPRFQQDGWRLDLNYYRILTSPARHMNVELKAPDGEMVTSLDLWSLDRKDGHATFYADDEKFSPILDDCRADNMVVTDFWESRRIQSVEGTGPDILVPFAKMLEFTAHGAEKDLRYEKFPEDWDTGESNSNGMAIALLEHAGLLTEEMKGKITEANRGMYNFQPGIADNLHQKIWPKGQESIFAAYDSNPQALLDNPQAMAKISEFADTLHMGRQQAEICEKSNTKECVVPVDIFRPK
ncbi:MAG: hypothetical protein KDI11_08855, partial [Alphaproteobacteria bacterium]|nr:hypothetical protein [Alphaproteobacteria bacterium]